MLFDPRRVSYDDLLAVFVRQVDFTARTSAPPGRGGARMRARCMDVSPHHPPCRVAALIHLALAPLFAGRRRPVRRPWRTVRPGGVLRGRGAAGGCGGGAGAAGRSLPGDPGRSGPAPGGSVLARREVPPGLLRDARRAAAAITRETERGFLVLPFLPQSLSLSPQPNGTISTGDSAAATRSSPGRGARRTRSSSTRWWSGRSAPATLAPDAGRAGRARGRAAVWRDGVTERV